MRSKKIPTIERKRPAFKPKEKHEKVKEKEPEVLLYCGIPYILIGHPGFEQVYAVDEKLRIDYALTGRLRKLMEENESVNKSQ